MKIDHIFMGSETPDEHVKILVDFGLTEGESNSHPQQGTAVRRFFFENSYFEFLYISNLSDIKSPTTRPAQYFERITANDNQTSPFAICFRPGGNSLDFSNYKSWIYRPKFLPHPFKMDIYGHKLSDPMLCYMGFVSDESFKKRIPQRHQIGFKDITLLRILSPYADLDSKLKQDLNKSELVKFKHNATHTIELTFDDAKQNKTHDFRPQLPIIFKW
ncbi:MAG: hypothetical protein COC24_004990 [Alphaproteobacteria bacterium]|nr:hypothetical protein [Alphaproteobacteria bacterium]